MKKNKINKRVIKQKITSVFIIFCFLFSSFFYAKPIYALDVNQMLANVVNWAQDISNAVDKIGGGVLKASLSTALNQFAKDLGQKTVNAIATGDWGQEPLYFNFSLEDTITAAVDNAVGSYLDDYIAKSGVDLCKPIGTVDVNWKFKLMLNVIPDLSNAETTTTTYDCTVSKFINNVKTSINNIMTSIQKTFAKDCFSEFETSDICGLANTVVSSLTAFDINSLKNVYGYDSSPTFCKETTYYLKSGTSASDFSKAVGNITVDSLCGTQVNVGGTSIAGNINSSLVDSNIWTTNSSECLKRSSTAVLDVSKLASSIFNTSDGSCLVSFKYCKFDNNGSPVFDKAKQKKFVNQYNNCYRTKIKEALGSLVEVGPALPTDKIIQQQVASNCDTIISSFLNSSSNSSDVDIMKRAVMSETDNKFAFFLTKKISPSVYAGYISINNIFSDNGETVSTAASTDVKSDFPYLSKIVFYTAKSWNDFQNQIGSNNGAYSTINKTAASYDILYFNDGSGTEYFYYQNDGKLNKINLISKEEYDKYTSENYQNLRTYMVSMCANLNSANADAYLAAETAQDNAKMAEIEANVQAEKENAKEMTEQTYQEGSFKSVTESISKQITTPSTAVQKQFETSLNVGTNALQPTGDLFIDPIKIFLTTLLSESSNSLLTGLFDTVMPTVSEPETTDFDANEYVNNEATTENTCNNTNDSSKFSNNTPCGANYQCQSCCCTTNTGSNTGIMYCLPSEYCE